MDEKSPAKIPEDEEEYEKVIKLLEERLVKHDESRKVIQNKFKGFRNKLTEQVDGLEERINRELCEKFTSEEDRLQAVLNELRRSSTISALQEAKSDLCAIQSYEIIENKEPNNDLTTLYELKIERRTVHEDVFVGLAISEVNSSTNVPPNATEKDETSCDPDKLAEERERLMGLLKERLENHDNNRKVVQDKLHEILNRLRAQIVELEDRVNKELEGKFTSEDDRLQATLNELRGNSTASALQKAKAELLVEQSYDIPENKKSKHDLSTLYELKAERRIIPELVETRKPINVRVADVSRGGSVSVQFTFFNLDEERVLSDNNIVNPVKYKCMLFKKGNEQESREYSLDKNEDDNSSFTFTPDTLETETTYETRVKIMFGDRENEWINDIAEFTTPEFKECCAWKRCPDDVDEKRKYGVDGGNPRIATNDTGGDCTIIGNTLIPFNAVTSWSVKILKSRDNDGYGIYIGVAPFDINQNDDNYNKCGWYFDCWDSSLCSGPPHSYYYKAYGPRKGPSKYVQEGDSVGVVMDTTKGVLSFVVNSVNLGVAFEGIPLDKPLVPCVLIRWKCDSIELNTSEIKENIYISVLIPSNTTVKNTTWDSITLTWDKVADASFYQIEVDGSKLWSVSTTNVFTKRGFFPETEHTFRVRTVKESTVGRWSSAVKGRTLNASRFSECVWKECPDDVDDNRKYSVDERNPRIATNVGNDWCTIIGNTYIPLNTVTQWNVKILKSWNNDGNGVFIGIAPSDIDQNDINYIKCGWYFHFWNAALYSGPHYSYLNKAYELKKEGGQYVHTGDSVGVVMDTTKSELSFALDGVNLGVAYAGIPLDKPLVPCILLNISGDSVGLII